MRLSGTSCFVIPFAVLGPGRLRRTGVTQKRGLWEHRAQELHGSFYVLEYVFWRADINVARLRMLSEEKLSWTDCCARNTTQNKRQEGEGERAKYRKDKQFVFCVSAGLHVIVMSSLHSPVSHFMFSHVRWRNK
ncbi:hypothetical protein BaRGS_00008316 [Batillaria attramentaria]|uniref:Uncharacterized protein n=1 Tax=Batillaria attramentaria TaxID=370345 RepID=A0ABD0LN27_9CAEN